ncbi:hypothetical protein LCGC14_1102690 [marine sediment metagenome]|uniref:Uncharacterized protein n=1 Tax=marine sediment metagenome TaxID=412755 RepID=A0A0F9MDI9_9ZZZZ
MVKCRYCGGAHGPSALCHVSRRKFFFIGGGVALGVALAPAAKMWEPYRFPCSSCKGSIVTYDKGIADSLTKGGPWGGKYKFPSTKLRPEGYIWPSPGLSLVRTTRSEGDGLLEHRREHLFERRDRRRFTGTRSWLANLAT